MRPFWCHSDLQGTSSSELGHRFADRTGVCAAVARYLSSSCIIPKALLKPGRYWLNLGAHVPTERNFDRKENVLAIRVLPVEGSFNSDRLGLLSPILDWEIRKLS